MRKFPRADFACNHNDLMLCVYSESASDLALLCGVGITTIERWRDGVEPVPYMAWQLIRFKALGQVPEFCGVWSGWRFIGNRLHSPKFINKGAATLDEIRDINDYRIDRNLNEAQSDLIASLIRQRDFYKRQCNIDAKFGLMLHNVFGGNDDSPVMA